MPVQGAFGAVGEAGGELAAGQPLDPGNILAEFAGEAFGTPAEIASVGMKGVRERIASAKMANENAALLTQLNEAVTASKVRTRDTSSFNAFIEAATKDGPVQDLYISPESLAQSGVSLDVLAQASPAVAEQIAGAAVGADIRIPVSDFAVGIAGTEFAQALIPHLKTEPGGFSQTEADAYMKTHGDDLRAAVDQALGKHEAGDATRASRDVVQADMTAKMQAAGVSPDAAKLYGALAAARYGTLAHQLGITPEQAYAQHPIHVQGRQFAEQGGQALEQGPDTPAFKAWFGDSKAVDAAGKPLVVYHGTSKDFDAFDAGKIDRPGFGNGFHFAEDAPLAAFYAENWNSGNRAAGDIIMPVYLSISKPFTGDFYKWGGDRGLGNATAITEALKAEGYDGIRYRHDTNGPKDRSADRYAWVAFRPEQIKSAIGNSGAFNPNDPNILKQEAAPTPTPELIELRKRESILKSLLECLA
jgi:hypothetical protein